MRKLIWKLRDTSPAMATESREKEKVTLPFPLSAYEGLSRGFEENANGSGNSLLTGRFRSALILKLS